MIPQFPNFKKLELLDQVEVESYVAEFDPYSDFNFINTWSWGGVWDSRVCYLNGNLLFKWYHSETDSHIYSFLGNNLVNDACETLFDYIQRVDSKDGKLSYIPEISLSGIDFKKYYIQIDIDVCDYVYELSAIASLSGKEFSQKRGRVSYFKNHNPNSEVKLLDLTEPKIQQEVFDVNKLWFSQKLIDQQAFEGENAALHRLIQAEFKNVFCVGLYVERLIGYAIFSTHRDDYIINHFVKADYAFKGVYDYLMQASVSHCLDKGFKYLNYLEDLGVKGLRQAKMAYRPVKYLRKYSIFKM